MRRLAPCVALALLCAQARAAAPSLNLQVHLDAGVIRVGDIWRDAGDGAATVIGAAPPPGRAITVDGPQLAYLARLFNVEWKPVSGVERVTIERPGRAVSREEIVGSVRRSLIEAGAPEDGTVELAGFNPVQVPPLATPAISVQEATYDPGSERFAATLLVAAEGMPTESARVAGRVVQLADAVIATRRIAAGQIVLPGDVRVQAVPQRRLGQDMAHDPAQVVGQAARRLLAAGQPVPLAAIGAPILVEKGEPVALSLATPGMAIVAQGRALTAGGQGDVIQVLNPASRAVLEARVTGPGHASVAPGSTPVTQAAGSPPRNPEIAQ